jgi:hypothetical protein
MSNAAHGEVLLHCTSQSHQSQGSIAELFFYSAGWVHLQNTMPHVQLPETMP